MSTDVAALDLLPAEEAGTPRFTCYPTCDLASYLFTNNTCHVCGVGPG
jgi:hypothetical protein